MHFPAMTFRSYSIYYPTTKQFTCKAIRNVVLKKEIMSSVLIFRLDVFFYHSITQASKKVNK